jgi:curved DNA-binding protein CbpA
MGAVQSHVDQRHLGIYKKLLAIQVPTTRLQMIDTLMGDPGFVHSAKVTGIYANLLQYSAAVRHGSQPPSLPGEQTAAAAPVAPQPQRQATALGYHPQQFQKPVTNQYPQANHPQANHPQANQLVTVPSAMSRPQPQQSYYQQVAKPKRSEKALNFFTACLRVLGIEEEVALTEETLKKAYKKAAIKAHPDKGGSKDAFDAVTRAFAYLMDILKLVKGQNGAAGQAVVPGLDTVQEQRSSAATEWQMPAEPVKLNPKNLDMNKFNQLFEQTRVPDPDEDGYGDWLKDEGGAAETGRRKIKGKAFSENFNREVFNRMFEEEAAGRGGGEGGQLIQFNHPQELVLNQSSGVELGRDRPADYTSAYDSKMGYTDLRAAYTKENTVSNKVSGIRVEERDFNSYKAQRERAPDAYNSGEMAALQAFEAQQKAKEEQRRLRAAQEHLDAQSYFNRMKQLVITEK